MVTFKVMEKTLKDQYEKDMSRMPDNIRDEYKHQLELETAKLCLFYYKAGLLKEI